MSKVLIDASIIKNVIDALEWHPVSEKPKDGSIILVKYHNDFITQGVVYYGENGGNNWGCYGSPKNQIKEWAYLPE